MAFGVSVVFSITIRSNLELISSICVVGYYPVDLVRFYYDVQEVNFVSKSGILRQPFI